MIETYRLDNGIRLVTEMIPYVQSVSMGIWVKAGCVDEKPEYAGISHFIEHMMFKGTKNRSAKAIAEDVDRIGGQINAFTGKEATCYYLKTLSSNFDKGAEILVDMLVNSTFATEEMDKERKVICEEIKMTLDTPDELASETIIEEVFKGNPLGCSIIGTPDTLNYINRERLIKYYREEYTRDNIVIAITGNFQKDHIIEFFSDKFFELNEHKKPKNVNLKPYEPSYKVIKKDIEQSHICLATKGIRINADNYYAMAILNSALGGSMSSRLFQNIREEKGLAYSVFSVSGSFSYDGYFNIYAGVAHDMIEAAIEGIREELTKLKAKGLTKEEIEMTKEQIKAHYIYGQENITSRMFSMGKNTLLIKKVFAPEEVINGIDSVSMDDINRIIDSISNLDDYCGVVVTNREIDLEAAMKGRE